MRLARRAFLFLALGVASAFAAENPTAVMAYRAEAPLSPEVLTDEGIIALADAGFSNAFIVKKVLIGNRTRFDVSAEGLAYLRRNAIPEELVQFIVEHASQPLFTPSMVPMTVATKVKTQKIVAPFGAVNVSFERGTVTPAVPMPVAAPYSAVAPVSMVSAPAIAPVAMAVSPNCDRRAGNGTIPIYR